MKKKKKNKKPELKPIIDRHKKRKNRAIDKSFKQPLNDNYFYDNSKEVHVKIRSLIEKTYNASTLLLIYYHITKRYDGKLLLLMPSQHKELNKIDLSKLDRNYFSIYRTDIKNRLGSSILSYTNEDLLFITRYFKTENYQSLFKFSSIYNKIFHKWILCYQAINDFLSQRNTNTSTFEHIIKPSNLPTDVSLILNLMKSNSFDENDLGVLGFLQRIFTDDGVFINSSELLENSLGQEIINILRTNDLIYSELNGRIIFEIPFQRRKQTTQTKTYSYTSVESFLREQGYHVGYRNMLDDQVRHNILFHSIMEFDSSSDVGTRRLIGRPASVLRLNTILNLLKSDLLKFRGHTINDYSIAIQQLETDISWLQHKFEKSGDVLIFRSSELAELTDKTNFHETN